MKKSKKEKNYYKEINTALKSFETFKPYHPHSIEWVCDRITWAWKFRKKFLSHKWKNL